MKADKEHLRRSAAALRYRQLSEAAPRLVGKGKGYLAHKIIDIARENGIPIVQNPDLISLLMELDVEDSIPEEAYKIVAEIYAFILKIDEDYQIV